MNTWAYAVLSLGFLLIAYRNWLGLALIFLGVVMILVARSKKKKLAQAEEAQVQAHRDVKIKARK